jgi:uncharacterized protein (DUF983 family)
VSDAAVSPFAAGLACKCPECGKGDLFQGYLRLRNSCPACGLDYSKADSGDGPAVFAIFIVGFAAVGIAFAAGFIADWPLWAALVVAAFGAAALIGLILRPLKATLIALQFRHKAEEQRFEA